MSGRRDAPKGVGRWTSKGQERERLFKTAAAAAARRRLLLAAAAGRLLRVEQSLPPPRARFPPRLFTLTLQRGCRSGTRGSPSGQGGRRAGTGGGQGLFFEAEIQGGSGLRKELMVREKRDNKSKTRKRRPNNRIRLQPPPRAAASGAAHLLCLPPSVSVRVSHKSQPSGEGREAPSSERWTGKGCSPKRKKKQGQPFFASFGLLPLLLLLQARGSSFDIVPRARDPHRSTWTARAWRHPRTWGPSSSPGPPSSRPR